MFIKKNLLTSLVFVSANLTGYVEASVIFDGRFSTGDFARYSVLEANGLSAGGVAYPAGIGQHLSLVADPVFLGRSVMAASRFGGDLPTHGGYRSEVSVSPDPLATERWYSWGVYFPIDWNPYRSEVVVMQIHDTADVFESGLREPTFRVSVQDGSLRLINSYDYDLVTSPPGSIPARKGVDYTQRILATVPVQIGAWTYFDLHAVWAGNDSGSLQVWGNGVSLFSEVGHINTFNDERGVWFKAGAYAYPNSDWTSLTTLFTGVRIGDGGESLQSMSMVPEPPFGAMLLVGLPLLIGRVRRLNGSRRRPAG